MLMSFSIFLRFLIAVYTNSADTMKINFVSVRILRKKALFVIFTIEQDVDDMGLYVFDCRWAVENASEMHYGDEQSLQPACRVKIICLLRTTVVQRVSSPNINKYLCQHAIFPHLSWLRIIKHKKRLNK